MTPPSRVHDDGLVSRVLHVHLDRRRMVLLGSAGVFLVIAVVFGVVAYFRVASQPHAATTSVSVPVTVTATVSAASPASSPAGGTGPPVPPAVKVTVTQTQILTVTPPISGSDIGSIETLASTLATVVAAACAVIALRPQGRRGPPAPAAAADAPASTPTS